MVTVRRRIKQRRESQPDVQSSEYGGPVGLVRDILHELVDDAVTRAENCPNTTTALQH